MICVPLTEISLSRAPALSQHRRLSPSLTPLHLHPFSGGSADLPARYDVVRVAHERISLTPPLPSLFLSLSLALAPLPLCLRQVEQLTSQLKEKADWCSELLLSTEQRCRELQERDEEIDKLESRIRELEQALLASAESLEKVRMGRADGDSGHGSVRLPSARMRRRLREEWEGGGACGEGEQCVGVSSSAALAVCLL